MADASVLKTDGGNPVRVRVPSPAPTLHILEIFAHRSPDSRTHRQWTIIDTMIDVLQWYT